MMCNPGFSFRRLYLCCCFLFLWTCGSAQALTLYFKNGTVMECESAFFEGEFARVKVKNGELRIPVEHLSEKTFNQMANGDKNEQAATETQIKTEQPKTPLPPSNLEIKGEETSVVPTLNPETAATATFTTPPDWKMISYKELKLDLPDPDPNIKVVEDTITLSGKPNSGLEGDKVVVHYRIAMQTDGKSPGPRAGQLLFYAPYINDTTGAKGRETQAYTDLMGFTVFSFRIKTNFNQLSDPSKAYWLPEAGWYELVFEAADKIRRKHNLKESKMFMWGNSSGSGMAQRLALKYPDKISAVALMGGSGYAPVEKASGLPWLVMNTLAASEQDDNMRLQAELKKSGDTVIYARTPQWRETRGSGNFYHSAGSLAISLAQSYFWSLYQGIKPDGSLLPAKSWPLMARGESPFDLYQVPQDIQVPDSTETEQWFRLPSPAMAFFWVQRPQPMKTEKMVLANGRSIPLILAQPRVAGPAPKGLVITTTEFNLQQYPSMANDLSHWAEEGFVALALRAPKATLMKGRETLPWKELLDWIKSRKELAALPIYLACMEGQSLPVEGWNEAVLKGQLKAVMVSEIDGDESIAKNKEKLEKYSLGVPVLAAFHVADEAKFKKENNDDKKKKSGDKLEERISQRFQNMMNPPTIYAVPSSIKSSEARQTYSIKRGAEFFQQIR